MTRRESDGVNRRGFIRRLPVLTAGLAGGLVGLSTAGCAGTAYLAPVAGPDGLSVPLSALGDSGGAFLQTPEMERPIYLHRDEARGWTAVLASCTHRGCQPEPVGGRLVCPCHGSEFSPAGEVLGGPADRALARYDVIEERDRLVIRTDGRTR